MEKGIRHSHITIGILLSCFVLLLVSCGPAKVSSGDIEVASNATGDLDPFGGDPIPETPTEADPTATPVPTPAEGEAALSFSPSSINFSSVEANDITIRRAVLLINRGEKPINLMKIEPSKDIVFDLTSGNCINFEASKAGEKEPQIGIVLGPRRSCTFYVHLFGGEPAGSSISGTFKIISDDVVSPLLIPYTGTVR